MTILLTDLLRLVPPSVEKQVRTTRNQARSVLQEALRAECRLVLRMPERLEVKHLGAQVPVNIDPAFPAALRSITFPDEIEVIVLLSRHRKILEEAHHGVLGLLRLREELTRKSPDDERWVSASESDLQSTFNWAQSLLKILEEQNPLMKVLSVREDILGIYKFDVKNPSADDREINRAEILLYWAVIGLVSEWMGCTVEDLTIVVLAHELAHAYTQLGADIEGRRWQAEAFAEAENEVKEGLAQYYTDLVLRRLSHRYAGAFEAYKQMLPMQSDLYRTHENWVKDSTPESVRRAMLEMRRWKEGTLGEFNQRLVEAQQQLNPRNTGHISFRNS